MLKLGIIGHAGRMGSTLVEHVAQVPDLAVVCRLELGESLEGFIAATPDVVVDFSLGAAVAEHGPGIVAARLPYIVGATGIPQAAIDELASLAQGNRTPVLIVPNFSVGANLMVRFAALAGRMMQQPVVTERHHDGKADAPSGTARLTADRIAEAARSGRPGDVPASTSQAFREEWTGVMGGSRDLVAVHSVRGRGYLAEQEVSFCLPGESLTIEHRSIDRRCFMAGVEYAIRNIGRAVGLQIGLDTVFDF
jgi:4-hydroxy-tetrahydrodipicolinate reductase